MSEQRFDPQEWITTAEAADLVGCTTHNLTRAVRSGGLNAIKRGRMLFFQRDEILEYIQEIEALGKDKHIPKIYRRPQKDRIQ